MKKILLILTCLIILLTAGYKIYFGHLHNRKINYGTKQIDSITKIDSVVVHKSLRKLTLFGEGKELKSYNISLGKNPVGPKQFEGDKKTPEGSYFFNWKNENSSYYLSIRISYPNDSDKAKANELGKSPGSEIMLHGLPNKMNFLEEYYLNSDWTDGCIAVSNDDMDELWSVIEVNTPITIYP